MQPAANKTPLT